MRRALITGERRSQTTASVPAIDAVTMVAGIPMQPVGTGVGAGGGHPAGAPVEITHFDRPGIQHRHGNQRESQLGDLSPTSEAVWPVQ